MTLFFVKNFLTRAEPLLRNLPMRKTGGGGAGVQTSS